MILYFLTGIAYFYNFLFVILKKNSKWISFTLFLAIFLIMVGANNSDSQNTDYMAYEQLYNHFKNGGTLDNIRENAYRCELGYMLAMRVISQTKLEYNFFLFIILVISWLLIFSFARKNTKNYSLFLLLYSIFPFFYDIIQTRYFFAYSIIIYSMKFLLFNGERNIFKYIVLVLFASFFHNSSLYFLIYVIYFINKNYTKLLLKLFMIIIIILFFLIISGKLDLVKIIFLLLKTDKLNAYTAENIKYKINPIVALYSIITFFSTNYLIKKIEISKSIILYKDLFWVNIITIGTIAPLMLISLDFERFLRPIMLVNLIFISKEFKNFTKNKMVILLIIFLLLVGRNILMGKFVIQGLTNNFLVEFVNKINFK